MRWTIGEGNVKNDTGVSGSETSVELFALVADTNLIHKLNWHSRVLGTNYL
jgi:hypothetical protein